MNFADSISDAKRLQTEGKLRFSAYAALLVKAGVESFTVQVSTLATKFSGRKGERYEDRGGVPRSVAAAYDAKAIDAAVRMSQRGELENPAFMDRLAAAGVSSFETRLGDGVIVYEGHGSSYAEAISR